MARVAEMTIIGHAGRDCEIKHTQNGMQIANLCIAVNLGKRDEDKTLWQDVTVFGKQAEFCSDIVKGDQVFASGRISMDKWQDRKTGESREKLVLIANNVQRLDKRATPQSSEPNAQPMPKFAAPENKTPDHIPF